MDYIIRFNALQMYDNSISINNISIIFPVNVSSLISNKELRNDIYSLKIKIILLDIYLTDNIISLRKFYRILYNICSIKYVCN